MNAETGLLGLKYKLAEMGVETEWGELDRWLKIERRDALITVEPRPHYCDRGRYIVKAFPRGYLSIDGADGFPRYYFGTDACAGEIRAWMEARGVSLAADAPAAPDRPAPA